MKKQHRYLITTIISSASGSIPIQPLKQKKKKKRENIRKVFRSTVHVTELEAVCPSGYWVPDLSPEGQLFQVRLSFHLNLFHSSPLPKSRATLYCVYK